MDYELFLSWTKPKRFLAFFAIKFLSKFVSRFMSSNLFLQGLPGSEGFIVNGSSRGEWSTGERNK